MGLKNLTHGHREHKVEYFHDYVYEKDRGAGFHFDCDGHGKLLPMQPAGEENYRLCQSGTVRGERVIYRGVQKHEWSYWEPGRGVCACGREVVLDGDRHGEGIDCSCGRIYNSGGQELAPRSQWDIDPMAEQEAEEDERRDAQMFPEV